MAPPAIPTDDPLAAAIEHQRAGRVEAAERIYRAILDATPDHADAHHNLGIILLEQGDAGGAVAHFERALEGDPSHGPYWLSLIHGLLACNDPDQALTIVDQAIECGLDTPAAHALRSRAAQAIARRSQSPTAAAPAAPGAVAPETVPPKSALRKLLDAKNAKRAAQQPTGQRGTAVAMLERGNALSARGDFRAAEALYREAIASDPHYAPAHSNLGAALVELGRLDEALQSFDRAIELAPDYAHAHCNRGVVLQSQRRLVEAALAYDRALRIDPNYAQAHANRGDIHKWQSDPVAARISYARAIELASARGEPTIGWRFRAAFALPVIPDDTPAIEAARRELSSALAVLERGRAADQRESIAHPVEQIGNTLFHLAYHAQSDRPILEAAARALRARAPVLDFRSPAITRYGGPGKRIRVGFVSEYLHAHTIGRLNSGLIRLLDRSRFHVTVIHSSSSAADPVRRAIDASADEVIVLPPRLAPAQHHLAAAALDALHFTDIGMGPFSYYLAFGRYAPVQSASWGHPETSGLASIDYYLSPDAAEPEGAEAEYTEQLVRTARFPSFYELPPDRCEYDRAALGLPHGETLYGCPQALFKIHPSFDAVLQQIVERDPRARIVMLEGATPQYARLLDARWRTHAGVLAERVLWLPAIPGDRYRSLLGAVDVLLDPLHFGSGNTLYEALARGAPLVTLPSRFMRGRLVAAAYAMAGVSGLTAGDAAEYVETAVAIANDSARNQAARAAQRRACGALFGDRTAVAELEAFFERAVYAAAHGTRLPAGWRPEPRP